MSFSRLKKSNGLTLTELITAMGVTSILMLIVVTGSFFVQNYIKKWTGESKLWEEAMFVQAELSLIIESSRENKLFADSLVVTDNVHRRIKYSWLKGDFQKNGKPLLRKGVNIEHLSVTQIWLLTDSADAKLPNATGDSSHGLYRIEIAVSEKNSITDTLSTVVRNHYEYFKN